MDIGSCHRLGDWEMFYGAVPQLSSIPVFPHLGTDVSASLAGLPQVQPLHSHTR